MTIVPIVVSSMQGSRSISTTGSVPGESMVARAWCAIRVAGHVHVRASLRDVISRQNRQRPAEAVTYSSTPDSVLRSVSQRICQDQGSNQGRGHWQTKLRSCTGQAARGQPAACCTCRVGFEVSRTCWQPPYGATPVVMTCRRCPFDAASAAIWLTRPTTLRLRPLARHERWKPWCTAGRRKNQFRRFSRSSCAENGASQNCSSTVDSSRNRAAQCQATARAL